MDLKTEYWVDVNVVQIELLIQHDLINPNWLLGRYWQVRLKIRMWIQVTQKNQDSLEKKNKVARHIISKVTAMQS